MNYKEDKGIDLSTDASEYDEEQSKEMKTDFNDQQDSKVEVKFKKVFHNCKLPSLATSGAAGYDLYSCTQKIIKPGKRVKFCLGFKMLLPHNYCAKNLQQIWLSSQTWYSCEQRNSNHRQQLPRPHGCLAYKSA